MGLLPERLLTLSRSRLDSSDIILIKKVLIKVVMENL